jgi:type I restriction enzyme R subunit
MPTASAPCAICEPIRSLGTPMEIIRAFGGKKQYEQAIRELDVQLYGAA